jgi:hypothetical protein
LREFGSKNKISVPIETASVSRAGELKEDEGNRSRDSEDEEEEEEEEEEKEEGPLELKRVWNQEAAREGLGSGGAKGNEAELKSKRLKGAPYDGLTRLIPSVRWSKAKIASVTYSSREEG